MPGGNANGEIGIVQMADDAAAENTGAAEDRHASRGHDVITRLVMKANRASTQAPAAAIQDRVQPAEGALRARFALLNGQLTLNRRLLRIACRPSQ
jgi:hypothetical protein